MRINLFGISNVLRLVGYVVFQLLIVDNWPSLLVLYTLSSINLSFHRQMNPPGIQESRQFSYHTMHLCLLWLGIVAIALLSLFLVETISNGAPNWARLKTSKVRIAHLDLDLMKLPRCRKTWNTSRILGKFSSSNEFESRMICKSMVGKNALLKNSLTTAQEQNHIFLMAKKLVSSYRVFVL